MTMTVSQTVRVRLDLAYDGTYFHGWATQPGQRTVQGEVEAALARILREPVVLTVAGRTDAGVHARGQVAHVDITVSAWQALPGRSSLTPGESLVRRLNAVLARRARETGGRPPLPSGYCDVVVRGAAAIGADFDARFSALWRAYTYRIADAPALWDPTRANVLWLNEKLDVDAMNRAGQQLLGEHDFLSYCKPRQGASTVRTLYELRFERHDNVIVGYTRADAFCHSQVRTLMGTLIEVGRGARGENWPYERLVATSRHGDVIVAPPHPLTLEEVGYPLASDYAMQAGAARRYRG